MKPGHVLAPVALALLVAAGCGSAIKATGDAGSDTGSDPLPELTVDIIPEPTTAPKQISVLEATELAEAKATAQAAQIRVARLMGYAGDACLECGQFTLVRNGTCLKCTTCGATTGCS